MRKRKAARLLTKCVKRWIASRSCNAKKTDSFEHRTEDLFHDVSSVALNEPCARLIASKETDSFVHHTEELFHDVSELSMASNEPCKRLIAAKKETDTFVHHTEELFHDESELSVASNGPCNSEFFQSESPSNDLRGNGLDCTFSGNDPSMLDYRQFSAEIPPVDGSDPCGVPLGEPELHRFGIASDPRGESGGMPEAAHLERKALCLTRNGPRIRVALRQFS